jgi:hypothetical protein
MRPWVRSGFCARLSHKGLGVGGRPSSFRGELVCGVRNVLVDPFLDVGRFARQAFQVLGRDRRVEVGAGTARVLARPSLLGMQHEEFVGAVIAPQADPVLAGEVRCAAPDLADERHRLGGVAANVTARSDSVGAAAVRLRVATAPIAASLTGTWGPSPGLGLGH